MSSGLRVNARYVSEEIPHNLGIGNVDIRLAVEFEENGEKAQFFGNREVFKSRATAAPQVQTAAIVYPEKGTFKVGVWLLDNVEGSVLRVRYYASKVTRDLSAVRKEEAVSVRVVPEVQPKSILEASAKLTNRIFIFAESHADRRLLRITEDNVIDESERAEFDAIMEDLQEIVEAALELRCARESS